MPSHALYSVSLIEKMGGNEFPSHFLIPLDGREETHPGRIFKAVAEYRGGSVDDVGEEDDSVYDGEIEISLDYETKRIAPHNANALIDVLPLVQERPRQFDSLSEARIATAGSGSTVINIALPDVIDGQGNDPIKGKLAITAQGVVVSLEGYSDYPSEDNVGELLLLEQHEGRAVLRVWDDINNEDCKSFSLETARNSNREELPQESVAM